MYDRTWLKALVAHNPLGALRKIFSNKSYVNMQ